MNRKNLLAMCIAGVMTSMLTTTVSQASDIEIYQEAKSGDITLMFMLDVSTSMNETDNQTTTRWQRVQVAMRDLLNGNTTKGITKIGDDKIIGLSTLGAISFNSSGSLNSGWDNRGAVLVPARRLDAVVSVDGTTMTQRALLVKRINDIRMKSATPTARSYAEVIAYLMGVATRTSNTPNGGWDYSDASTKTGTGNSATYNSPASLTQTDAIKSCSGQGIYVLTDGEPNNYTNTSTLASRAINKSGFSCNSNELNTHARIWDCTNKLNEALIDPNKNGKGLKFKTAVVGFGNGFNSIASYDKTKTQAENIAALGAINTHQKYAAQWGILGEGGWYSGNNSQDVVDSVNEFINSLATDIPSVTTGTPNIPVDELNPTILQNYAYYPQFQPTPDKTYQSWLGNLKKYTVKDNGLLDKTPKKIVDNKGKLLINYDLWSYPVSTNAATKAADVDTIGSDLFAQMGGMRSQLQLQAQATSTKIVNRKLLTNRSVTPTSGTGVDVSQGTTLKTIDLEYLTEAGYKNDPARGYLMNLLGYAIDPKALANITLDNLRKSSTLRQVGAVMHSSPLLLTNEGTMTYNEATGISGSTSREDYILFGSTQGLLHVVDAETGIEKFAFVPNEMVDKQKEAFTTPDATSGGLKSLYYGIDGPWTTYTEYVLKGTDGLTVGTGKNSQKGKQIAYGGLRMGGKSYYALDLADMNDPKMLFQIDPENKKVYFGSGSKSYTELEHMGQSWSKPSVTWVRWNGERKLVMIVGGGYDAEGVNTGKTNQKTTDKYRGYEYDNYAQSNGIGGGVYMFDALNGDLLFWASSKATTSTTSAGNGPIGLKVDNLKYSVASEIRTVDRDSDGLTDHLYFGDLGGQVFRIDLNNNLAKNNKHSFAKNAVRILNTNSGESSPRFYEMPAFSVYDYQGQPFGVVSIGSGNRSLPLIDYTTGSAYKQDAIYNVYDKDVARTDLYTTTTFNTPDRATAGNHLVEIKDSNRFSTANPLAPYSTNGWYYEFVLGNKQQSEKVLSTPIVIKSDMFVSTFDGSKPGLSGDCGAGVKGESFTTLFCMPYGQCSTGNATNYRLSAGVGITSATIGGEADGTRKIVVNTDTVGGTGGSEITGKTYKPSNSLIVQRWYEKL